MGKTFEALERAEQEFKKGIEKPAPANEENYMPSLPKKSRRPPVSGGLPDLKSKLLTRYTGDAVKTILVTATAHGSGASTTAIGLASTLSRDAGLRVLLMDANFRTPGLHERFKTECTLGLHDLMCKDNGHSAQFKHVGPDELYLLSSGVNGGPVTAYFESPRFEKMVQSARNSFHYVILDCAPVSRFPDAQAICARVDGVVLVVEAGATRLQVAQRAKKELEDAGGKILGVVLTKRRRYIPEWIYQRL